MLFNIERDTGDQIVGYVVPDGVSTSLDLRICAGENNIFAMRADEARPALVSAGRHETGACGFSFSAEQIPDLATIPDLTIYEQKSGLLIYRRPASSFLRRKVLRLETHMMPLWRLDGAIARHFQYSLHDIEKYGKETTTQLFLLNNIDSVYLSGRILFRNYAYFIESKFECAVLLQNPYEEMAERILLLRQLKKSSLPHLDGRDIRTLGPAIAFAENINVDDEASVLRAFKTVPEAVTTVLSDPLSRQLTANAPGDMPAKTAVSTALDILSMFTIVSLRSEADTFLNALGEFLGLEPETLPPIPRFAKVPELANMLRRSRQAGYLIEKDRELYGQIAGAFKKAAQVGT